MSFDNLVAQYIASVKAYYAEDARDTRTYAELQKAGEKRNYAALNALDNERRRLFDEITKNNKAVNLSAARKQSKIMLDWLVSNYEVEMVKQFPDSIIGQCSLFNGKVLVDFWVGDNVNYDKGYVKVYGDKALVKQIQEAARAYKRALAASG